MAKPLSRNPGSWCGLIGKVFGERYLPTNSDYPVYGFTWVIPLSLCTAELSDWLIFHWSLWFPNCSLRILLYLTVCRISVEGIGDTFVRQLRSVQVCDTIPVCLDPHGITISHRLYFRPLSEIAS